MSILCKYFELDFDFKKEILGTHALWAGRQYSASQGRIQDFQKSDSFRTVLW